MVKSASIGIRVEPTIYEAIRAAAAKDRRTMASLIEKVMVDWLEETGQLSHPATKKKPSAKS
jgi:hypothetical protein